MTKKYLLRGYIDRICPISNMACNLSIQTLEFFYSNKSDKRFRKNAQFFFCYLMKSLYILHRNNFSKEDAISCEFSRKVLPQKPQLDFYE